MKQNVTDVIVIGHSESITLTASTPHRDVLQQCAHPQNEWRG